MITVRLQIDNGAIYDTYDQYGLIYLSSDHRFAPPTKGFATSTYAEEAGEHTDPRTVDDAFDYKVKFCIEAPNRNINDANAKIAYLNSLMYSAGAKTDTERDGIKTFKTFTFYNDYKRVKIVGIPKPIAEVKEDDLFRDSHGNIKDIVVCELTIHVDDPSLCDWDCYSKIETFSPKDLTRNYWFGLMNENATAYLATSGGVSGLKAFVKKGSLVRVTTKGLGEAVPLIITTERGRQDFVKFFQVQWFYNENLDLDDFTFTSEYDGALLVSCANSAVDKFSLVIDNDPQATETLEEDDTRY